ncbi:MAG: hypothetical protein PHI27_11695 [Eubacteriales bacterium]|nr:hypothetical protein [Eubacteriales bacterium]MDD3880761.1 hypothetical protein [Eubacteriales bacterium]MDD3882892.1 hypothetical protein [Eubacteriales bacterium]MDD4511606.1 hypothetical protein [Eubacteriales bacterium]
MNKRLRKKQSKVRMQENTEMYDDFIVTIGKMFVETMENRKNEDYELNPPQFEKLMALYEFVKTLTTSGDRIAPMKLEPKEQVGSIEADFIVFDVTGEKIQELARLMTACSVITIDVTRGKVHMECNVPDVFVEKDETEKMPVQ